MIGETRDPVALRNSAFTLTELLVVIAVIAILASLLLTSLPQAKSSAYRAACQSNLRQLGIALRLYVDEHGVFPTDEPLQNLDWKDTLSGYLGPGSSIGSPASILCCPKAGVPPDARTYGYNGLGFGPNQGLFGEPTAEGYDPVKESGVVAPAGMIAIGDGFLKSADGRVLAPSSLLVRFDQMVSASEEALSGWARVAAQRHNNKANIVFCDGHVQLLPNRWLFLEDSEDALRQWNKDNQPHSGQE